MEPLEWIALIKTAQLVISESTSLLTTMRKSIQNAKNLADADKTTLLSKIDEAQRESLKFPESET